MKITFRIVVLLLLLAALVGAVQAEHHDFVFCGNLAAEDCTLLQESQANAATQTSGSTTMDADLTLRNFGTEAPGEYVISLDAEAVWNGDFTGMEAMGAASMGLMNDPEQLMTMMADMLEQLSGRVTVSLGFPNGLPSVPDGEIPAEFMTGVSMEMRLVDGVAYIDLSELAAVMPADEGIPAGWLGFNIPELMQLAMMSGSMGEFTPGDEKGMKDPRSGGDKNKQEHKGAKGDDAMSQDYPSEMNEMLEAWVDQEFLGQFVTIERLEDQSIDGQQAAVFQTEVDLQALMNSAEFHEMLRMGNGMVGGESDDDNMAGIAMMVGMFSLGLDIQALEFISLADTLPLRDELHITMDLTAMMSMMGEAGDADQESSVGLDFLVDYSFSAEAQTITAPENAFFMTSDMMQTSADA